MPISNAFYVSLTDVSLRVVLYLQTVL